MYRWRAVFVAGLLVGCNSVAGLGDLSFDAGTSAAGAAGPGATGSAGNSSGGNGGAGGGSGGGAGAPAPCGVSGPFDVGVAGDVTSVPFIAALPRRWGIAWRVGDTTRFVTVGADGVPMPALPVGLPTKSNFATAVTATSSHFYVASNDDPDHVNGALHQLGPTGNVVRVLGVDGPSWPAQMRAIGRGDAVLVTVQFGGQDLSATLIDDNATVVSNLTNVPGLVLSCCGSRDWQLVTHEGGFAMPADTASPEKLVAFDEDGNVEFATDQDGVPLSSGAAVGLDVYLAASSVLWKCNHSPAAWTCTSTPFESDGIVYRGVTTDGATLWATASDPGAIRLQAYDYNAGAIGTAMTIEATAVARPVFAYDGEAWGVAWLEDSTIRFATARVCP